MVTRNAEYYEKYLTKTLVTIVGVCGLQWSEWDLDKHLLTALKRSTNLTKVKEWCRFYDSVLADVKENDIKINSKFYWFERL